MPENNASNFYPYRFGHRVREDYNHPNGWENVELNDIPTDKPIVLCFGGNGTISDRFANHVAKMAERFLGVRTSNNYIDIYSIQYSNKENSMTGDLSYEEAEEIANTLFLPRVMNKNGKRLPVEKACKNMRNINILSHCFGQQALKPIITYTENAMEYQLGYDEEEVMETLGQILHISYAPYSITPNNLSTNFEIKSFMDRINDYDYEYAQLYDKEKWKNDSVNEIYLGIGELKTKDNTLTLYTNSVVGDKFRKENNIDEHNWGKTIARDENWNVNNPRADAISKCIALTLAMGVLNSKENQKSKKFVPLPKIKEIKSLIEPILDRERETKFEKENKEYWEKVTFGVPFSDFLKEKGITEQDIINGKIAFKDIISEQKINFQQSDFKNISTFDLTKPSKLAEKILQKKELMITERGFEKCGILFNDGKERVYYSNSNDENLSKNWVKHAAVESKLNNYSLDNSVIYELSVDKKDTTNNKLEVKSGIKFEDKKYNSLDELKKSIIPSVKEKNHTLTTEQTRILLNLAIAANVPISGIIMQDGLQLDGKVLENEIDIDEHENILPLQSISKPTSQMSA